MAADEPVYVMLDANVLLHYQRPDQIDWLAMRKCRSVRLIITPILLKELEKQKVTNPSRKLRERARSLVTWLGVFIESETPLEVRKGVAFSLVRHSPQIDYAQHRLSQVIADDELIAAAIEYQSEHGCSVWLCTADMGLRLKLPAHGLRPIILPDELMLPNEPDEVERENLKLKAELARQQQRLPLLQFSFLDGSDVTALPNVRADEGIAPEPLSQLSQFSQFNPSAYIYPKYLSDFSRWKREVRFSTAFRVCLKNAGTGAATNVRIQIDFPDFVYAARPPSMPELSTHFLSDVDPQFASEEAPTYSDNKRRVIFGLDSLVHNRTLESDPVYLRFRRKEAIQNFAADFLITCVELIKPIQGKLRFTVDDDWTASSRGQKS